MKTSKKFHIVMDNYKSLLNMNKYLSFSLIFKSESLNENLIMKCPHHQSQDYRRDIFPGF